MSRTPFTAVQVERALRGAKRAGLAVAKVEITPSGSIIILPNLDPAPSDEAEGWFAKRRGRGTDPDDRD